MISSIVKACYKLFKSDLKYFIIFIFILLIIRSILEFKLCSLYDRKVKLLNETRNPN